MGCFGRKSDKGKVPVYLNVYDLTPMNGYGYWLGLGAYHSGVQGFCCQFFFFLMFFGYCLRYIVCVCVLV